jgi:hypothetical protein
VGKITQGRVRAIVEYWSGCFAVGFPNYSTPVTSLPTSDHDTMSEALCASLDDNRSQW